jgi:stage II sporulation protein AA (anti-sigma F factor antagonist)
MLDLKLSRQVLSQSPKVVVVRLAGQAEFSNSLKAERYFDSVLQEEAPRHVLLDLGELTFADSAFFSSLLFWKERLNQQGGQLVLYGLRPEIAGPMRIMALDRVLTVRADQPAALEALAA